MFNYGDAETGIKMAKIKTYKVICNREKSNGYFFLLNVCIDISFNIILNINYIEKYHFLVNKH